MNYLSLLLILLSLTSLSLSLDRIKIDTVAQPHLMAGEAKEVGLNEQNRKALVFALQEFNKRYDGANQYAFYNTVEESVISITSQVVSGNKYTFHVKLDSSVGNVHVYKFVVWSQSWKNHLELVEATEISSQE